MGKGKVRKRKIRNLNRNGKSIGRVESPVISVWSIPRQFRQHLFISNLYCTCSCFYFQYFLTEDGVFRATASLKRDYAYEEEESLKKTVLPTVFGTWFFRGTKSKCHGKDLGSLCRDARTTRVISPLSEVKEKSTQVSSKKKEALKLLLRRKKRARGQEKSG